jgi:predicted site-specific integrase-resolvase
MKEGGKRYRLGLDSVESSAKRSVSVTAYARVSSDVRKKGKKTYAGSGII